VSDPLDTSLVRSGPFHRGLRRLRLLRGDRSDLARLSLTAIAITWAPIVILELLRVLSLGENFHLLRQFAVHARFLVALPLIFTAEQALHQLCGRAIEAFAAERVALADGDPTAPLVERAIRWSASTSIETALALACFGTQIGVWVGTKKAGLLLEFDVASGLSPARAWYVFFSLPLVNFLSLRLIFRWLVWAWLLYRFSRFELRTVPTHPDKAGGLGPLAEPALGLAALLAGISAVLAAVWADRSLAEGLRITAFADEFSVIVILGEILALAPLTVFSKRLVQTRLEGLIEYGELGFRYARAFHQRWVDTPREEGLLGSSDIQSLADLANSYEVIQNMRFVPFTLRHVIVVFAAIAAPMSPLILMEVPMHDLLERVGRTLLGGLPP
jgi:hypothetical protein